MKKRPEHTHIFRHAVLGALALFACCAQAFAGDPVQHKMLLLDESRSQLLYVDQAAPDKDWKLAIPSRAWSFQLVGGNRLLLGMTKKGGFLEYDLETKKVVREVFDAKRYADTTCAIRFPDGRTAISCNQKHLRIFLFDAQGRETAALEFPKLRGARQIRRTGRDTLLFGAGTPARVYEVSLDGKVLREAPLPGGKDIYQVSELANGNWLAAAGYGGFIAEIDKDGKIVRRWGGKPEPEGVRYFFMSHFQVLKNGNIAVATWTGHGAKDSKKGQQVVEFDPAGNIVWKWHDAALAGSIHGVFILDGLDPAQFYDDVIAAKGGSEK
ncbi:MAG: hypothetical protein LBV54_02320 [Puniceicoccales bacterium]|jgi:hypothetical protein|nr:hypothetical protein [Puniceicoccales bacterium]